MKTETLLALEASLEAERRHFQSYALLVCEQWQARFCKRRVREVEIIVSQLRAEIAVRAGTHARSPGELRRFDECLQRALEVHLDLDPVGTDLQEHVAA